ncbi:DUF4136 domain-containing protein [Flavobacterium bizetiae]|uniref:DUF4136 domain-containing protein n=1 Tax=Flavobacterium bizetiae TaxID=2704140 RepID=UPI0021E6E144|nr:DUF4136 domain-containing protein [Flavobacterium bizetiae]UTN02851.1 DUF4136 domain-containing protein [Flavobacterium bizetiae]
MTATKIKLPIILLLLTGLFYSCSPSLKVTTDYDRDTNFGELRTYTIYDLKAEEGQMSQLNVDRVTNAIRTEMNGRGFIETAKNPDVKVNAVSILKNKTEVVANTTGSAYVYGGRYRPYRYWGGTAMVAGSANTTYDTYDYVDGSLIIDIVSTKTGKLVWQGIGNTQISSKPGNPDELVAAAIKKMLADFPPGEGKKK